MKQSTAAAASTVDVEKLSPEDKLFYQKYGRLPPTKQLLSSRLKNGERKYFDSGDYALSKVGKSTEVGSAHPSPERIPHSIPAGMKKESIIAAGIQKETIPSHLQNTATDD